MYENKLFSACFIVWMYRYTTFEIKVDLCAHTDSKNGIFTRRVYSAYILTRTPSPFSAGWRWGLLSRKIFYFFLNPLSTRSNYTLIFIFQILARIHRMSGLRIFFYFLVSPILFLLVFYFFIFSDFRLDSCFDSVFQIILFNYFDSIKIRHLILDFIFQTLHRFDSLQVITRHSPSVSFYIHHVWISRFQTLNFDSFLLVEFYLHQFRLVSALKILCFDSSACYKQTSMLMWFVLCLFWLF